MRVLHLYAGNLYGGIERMLVTLARERHHAPDMQPHFGLCFEGRLSTELREAGVAVALLGEVRFSRPWTLLAARRRLSELLLREPFDVAICHSAWPHAAFGKVVRQADLPLVYWAHGPGDATHWLDRRAQRIPPDLVIANSRWTQASMQRLFDGTPAHVIYCPVPLLPPRPAARATVRLELGAPLDAVVIVMAARMEEGKGHRVLLRALRRLSGVANWECWVAGSSQRPSEQRYCADLQRLAAGMAVKFLGHRDDLSCVFAAADLLCQPNSGPEGFGIVFVEALSAGLPVVTSRLGGATEIVDDSCGVLVPPRDEVALAGALSELIDDPGRRARLSAGGPARARLLCDPSSVMRRLQGALAVVAQAGAA